MFQSLGIEAIVNHKRNPHELPQMSVFILTKADDNHTLHIPHRGKFDNICQIGGGFKHHEAMGLFDFYR